MSACIEFEMLSVGLLCFYCFGQMVWVAVNVFLFWRTFMLYFSGAQYYYLHKMLGVSFKFMCQVCVFKFGVCELYRHVRLEKTKCV